MLESPSEGMPALAAREVSGVFVAGLPMFFAAILVPGVGLGLSSQPQILLGALDFDEPRE